MSVNLFLKNGSDMSDNGVAERHKETQIITNMTRDATVSCIEIAKL